MIRQSDGGRSSYGAFSAAIRRVGQEALTGRRFGASPTIRDSDNENVPIGQGDMFPEGYVAPGGIRDFSGQHIGARQAEALGAAGRGHGSIGPVKPRYFENDVGVIRPYSREAIEALQRSLAMAGLLPDDFQPGIWDPNTNDAFKDVLAMANVSGMTWEQTLLSITDPNGPGGGGSIRWNPETGSFERVSMAGAGQDSRPMVPELVTRITDPKVLKSVFRQATIDTLGIGWDDQMLDRAAATFNQIERQRQRELYNAQLAAGQLGNLTQGGPAPEAREVVDIPSPEGWIDQHLRKAHPREVAANTALDMVDVFMQTAGSTAWGVGRQI